MIDSSNQMIYKILTQAQWLDLEKNGEFKGAPIDLADGYVHFSNANQVQETADKHFKNQANLMLVAMGVEAMGSALKWEPSRGGDLFPHLYSPMRLNNVIWAKALPLVDGQHQLPELERV